MDYDALRAAHPELRISVYGMTPGSVTLEIITPDDMVFPFVAATLTRAIEMAFPDDTVRMAEHLLSQPSIRNAIAVNPTVVQDIRDALATDADVSDVTPEPNIFD